MTPSKQNKILESLSLSRLVAANVALSDLIDAPSPTSFRDKATAVARVAKTLATVRGSHPQVRVEADGSVAIEAPITAEPASEETAPAEKRRGGRESAMPACRVVLLRKENPKRAKSRTHARYALYTDGMLAADYMRICTERGLGSRREILSDLAWDSDQQFIRLDPVA